ncbi:MAG: hypothetical protein SCK57_12865 [Bacillota bacterium]|nr:hypothetical protein [Bacillota bacterium]MDW7678545.1 hypothetical protein [Bacillota bacterium]
MVRWDSEYLSGFETYQGAFTLEGTVHEEVKLQEMGIRVQQGEEVREGSLAFGGTGTESTYIFGTPNLHGFIFPGSNEIRVWAKSITGAVGYSKTIWVHYEALAAGAEAELLILTPGEFHEALEPLRDWKNNTGIPARIMTLKAIEQESRFDMAASRDLPERVKKAIARAYTHHGTRWPCARQHLGEHKAQVFNAGLRPVLFMVHLINTFHNKKTPRPSSVVFRGLKSAHEKHFSNIDKM